MDKEKMIKKFKTYEANISIDPFGEEDWNHIDYKKIFIDFLMERDLYDIFLKNFNLHHGGRNLNNYLDRTNKNLYLLNAFDWSTTDEVVPWNSIDDEWLNILLEQEEGEVNEKNTSLDPYDEEYWEDIRDIFIDFLKGNDAYEPFSINLKRRNKNIWTLFHKEYPMDYIGRGFDWDNTQEGHRYWGTLNQKWTDILKNMYWKKHN